MTVRKVSKWEFDGQVYDSKEDAQRAERRAIVKHLLEEAGFNWRVADPISDRWEDVEKALQEARRYKLTPPRADG